MTIDSEVLRFCYDKKGFGDGTRGGGKADVVGPLNAEGFVGWWVVNGGGWVKPNGFAIPKIIFF